MFNIVLVEPEIPQNTGNIVRTCVATGCKLHLVKPLGFSVSDKYLKRAGLDYWKDADIFYYESIKELFDKHTNSNFYFFSTKAGKVYTDIKYQEGDFFVFGKETKGLDEKLLQANLNKTVRLPMVSEIRSLNLSNTVAIAIYEGWRQLEFIQGNLFGKFKD